MSLFFKQHSSLLKYLCSYEYDIYLPVVNTYIHWIIRKLYKSIINQISKSKDKQANKQKKSQDQAISNAVLLFSYSLYLIYMFYKN